MALMVSLKKVCKDLFAKMSKAKPITFRINQLSF